MTVTTYQQMLKVRFQHDYYVQKAAQDFVVQASPATAALMRRHRMRMGVLNTASAAGFDIAYAASSGRTPLRALPIGFRLSFWLTLADPTLLHVSELDTPGAGKVHYFGMDELATSETMLNQPPQTVALRGSHFMHRFSKPGGDPAVTETLQILDARDGSEVATYELEPDSSDNYSVELRLQDLPEGLYQFAYTTYDSLDETFYLSDAAQAAAPFAIVEITDADAEWDYDTATAHYLQMAAKSAVWHYWFLREGGVEITYEDRLPGVVGPYPEDVHLRLVEDGDVTYDYGGDPYTDSAIYTTTLARLTDRYPTATVELWITASAGTGAATPVLMPYYELPRPGMAIEGTALGDYLYTSLPNPQRKRLSAEQVIFLPEGTVA